MHDVCLYLSNNNKMNNHCIIQKHSNFNPIPKHHPINCHNLGHPKQLVLRPTANPIRSHQYMTQNSNNSNMNDVSLQKQLQLSTRNKPKYFKQQSILQSVNRTPKQQRWVSSEWRQFINPQIQLIYQQLQLRLLFNKKYDQNTMDKHTVARLLKQRSKQMRQWQQMSAQQSQQRGQQMGNTRNKYINSHYANKNNNNNKYTPTTYEGSQSISENQNQYYQQQPQQGLPCNISHINESASESGGGNGNVCLSKRSTQQQQAKMAKHKSTSETKQIRSIQTMDSLKTITQSSNPNTILQTKQDIQTNLNKNMIGKQANHGNQATTKNPQTNTDNYDGQLIKLQLTERKYLLQVLYQHMEICPLNMHSKKQTNLNNKRAHFGKDKKDDNSGRNQKIKQILWRANEDAKK